jgi:hypothetical protein
MLIHNARQLLGRLLAYIMGLVNQRVFPQCEYLIAENRVRRSHVCISILTKLCKRSKDILAYKVGSTAPNSIRGIKA